MKQSVDWLIGKEKMPSPGSQGNGVEKELEYMYKLHEDCKCYTVG